MLICCDAYNTYTNDTYDAYTHILIYIYICIYIYIYIYRQTRILSFPGLVNVARVNDWVYICKYITK